MHEKNVSLPKSRGVHGLGQPTKPDQTHPKKSKNVGWVGWLGG